MHCIILAAGFATRLYPLTHNFPKALLPLKGKALVDYLIEDVIDQKDISHCTVVTNGKFYPIFKKHIKNAFPGKDISVINNGITDESQKNGAIKDVLIALTAEKVNDDILVLASDTYTSLRLQDFIRFYKQFKTITTAVYDGGDKERIRDKLGCAVVKKNVLIQFIEKPAVPPSTLMAVPFYIIPAKELPFISDYIQKNNADAPGSFIAWAIQKTPVHAFNMGSGYYHDIGTKEAYDKIKSL